MAIQYQPNNKYWQPRIFFMNIKKLRSQASGLSFEFNFLKFDIYQIFINIWLRLFIVGHMPEMIGQKTKYLNFLLYFIFIADKIGDNFQF